MSSDIVFAPGISIRSLVNGRPRVNAEESREATEDRAAHEKTSREPAPRAR